MEDMAARISSVTAPIGTAARRGQRGVRAGSGRTLGLWHQGSFKPCFAEIGGEALGGLSIEIAAHPHAIVVAAGGGRRDVPGPLQSPDKGVRIRPDFERPHLHVKSRSLRVGLLVASRRGSVRGRSDDDRRRLIGGRLGSIGLGRRCNLRRLLRRGRWGRLRCRATRRSKSRCRRSLGQNMWRLGWRRAMLDSIRG